MIGQSMINVNSGGRGRLSGISAALFLLLFILWPLPLIEQIPLAALIGVMFIVVIGTLNDEFSYHRQRLPRTDSMVLILWVSGNSRNRPCCCRCGGDHRFRYRLCLEHAKHIRIEARAPTTGLYGVRSNRPLFFGSVNLFERFDPQQDNDELSSTARSRVARPFGAGTIDTLAEHLNRKNCTWCAECRKLLRKAGNLVEVNVIEDPKYFVAEDSLA